METVAALIVLPLLLTALFHHLFVIPRNVFSRLAMPLDNGHTHHGRPILGKAKTWRGLVVMSVGTAIVSWIVSWLIPFDTEYFRAPPLATGFLLGLFYSAGELPTSFLKRRLDVQPSTHRYDATGWWLYILEQADSILAVLIAAFFLLHIGRLSMPIIVGCTLLGILLHIAIDLWLYAQGYKRPNHRPALWYFRIKR